MTFCRRNLSSPWLHTRFAACNEAILAYGRASSNMTMAISAAARSLDRRQWMNVTASCACLLVTHDRRLPHCWKDGSVDCKNTLRHRTSLSVFDFYARQHICYSAYMLSPARPSVRLSVTRVYHRKTAEVRIMKFSPYGSLIPLVFRDQVLSRNSGGFPHSGVLNEGGGR